MGYDLPNEEETVNHINFLPQVNFLQQQENMELKNKTTEFWELFGASYVGRALK